MPEVLTVEGVFTLMMLIFLQAVLGFDNLLYISIESRRAPPEAQARVRRLGIGIAIALRLVLLFAILALLDAFKAPLFTVETEAVSGAFTFGTIVFLLGGAFIMYTAMKEIAHMLSLQHLDTDVERRGQKSASEAIFWIVLMNLVFSFDSILSAVAITTDFITLAIAIVLSGALMIILADRVSSFLERNRMYEVLGLFILLIVGVLLLSEGGEKAGLAFFGYEVEAMSKTTFYFSVVVMVLLDLAQSRYKKRLALEKRTEIRRRGAAPEGEPSVLDG